MSRKNRGPVWPKFPFALEPIFKCVQQVQHGNNFTVTVHDLENGRGVNVVLAKPVLNGFHVDQAAMQEAFRLAESAILPSYSPKESEVNLVRRLGHDAKQPDWESLKGVCAVHRIPTNPDTVIQTVLGGLAEVIEADNDPQSRLEEIDELEETTPLLDRDNGLWVRNRKAAKLEELKTETLSSYRKRGVKNLSGTLGKDNDGRVWRKPADAKPNAHPWYLRSTLISEQKNSN